MGYISPANHFIIIEFIRITEPQMIEVEVRGDLEYAIRQLKKK